VTFPCYLFLASPLKVTFDVLAVDSLCMTFDLCAWFFSGQQPAAIETSTRRDSLACSLCVSGSPQCVCSLQDGLWLVTQHPELVHGYKLAILTPNPNEHKRLVDKVFGEDYKSQQQDVTQQLKDLATRWAA
jgi:hypothetical protein